MRPDVALAFDRMEAAARADGVALTDHQRLPVRRRAGRALGRHPDPKWVARPGTSLHRYGTELDLGPPSAYGWLAANAGRFHFIQRYAWEPWHFGYALNAAARQRAARRGATAGRPGRRAAPCRASCPPRFAPMLRSAAQRWNVSATLLAAQLYAEIELQPVRAQPAGRAGDRAVHAGHRAGMGLDDPFDAGQAIDAQAHLMRDLLRPFGSVPLALAAYNAGPGAVAALRLRPALPGDPRLRRPHPRADAARARRSLPAPAPVRLVEMRRDERTGWSSPRPALDAWPHGG